MQLIETGLAVAAPGFGPSGQPLIPAERLRIRAARKRRRQRRRQAAATASELAGVAPVDPTPVEPAGPPSLPLP